MSDDYICSICGHRAGDHASANTSICLATNCKCREDPYLEQLTALNMYVENQVLRKKLEIALEALNEIKHEFSHAPDELGMWSYKTANDAISQTREELQRG